MSRKNRRPPDETSELLGYIENKGDNQGLFGAPEGVFADIDGSISDEKSAVFVPDTTGVASAKFLSARVNKLGRLAGEITRENTPIDQLPEWVLTGFFEESAMIEAAVRDAIKFGDRPDKKPVHDKLMAMRRTVIGRPGNTLLRVSLPPLMWAKMRGAYNVYFELKELLSAYFQEHGIPETTDQKLFLLYKKYAPNLSSDYTCDNDNWESQRVTNAIIEAIGRSDEAANLSLVYTAVLNPNRLVEATLIEEKNLSLFLDYLKDERVSQPLKSTPHTPSF